MIKLLGYLALWPLMTPIRYAFGVGATLLYIVFLLGFGVYLLLRPRRRYRGEQFVAAEPTTVIVQNFYGPGAYVPPPGVGGYGQRPGHMAGPGHVQFSGQALPAGPPMLSAKERAQRALDARAAHPSRVRALLARRALPPQGASPDSSPGFTWPEPGSN